MQVEEEQPHQQAARKDSVANISRRYKHLFRLPARNRLILYASAPALVMELASRFILREGMQTVLLFLFVTEGLLLLSIWFDSEILKRRSKVATFRRLSSIALISNAIWFVLTLVGLLVYFLTTSEARFLSLAILGGFFAASFRALILGSLFYDKPWQAIPLSFLQPVLLFGAIASSSRALLIVQSAPPSILSGVIGGALGIVAIEIYTYSLNRPTKIGNFRAFELLQAFLNAWAVEDANNFERFLDATSKECTVRSQILAIKSVESQGRNNSTALLIVPGVHPGPFYPIGSSNLPGDIFSKLAGNGVLPLTVHSISDHDLNLTSKRQVDRFVSTLDHPKLIEAGDRMSAPETETRNKATIHGLAFGKSVFITITQAPYGMEDFPTEVREGIESYARSQGFSNVFVIDTHNSEGAKPTDEECRDALDATFKVLGRLRNAPQKSFRVGFAHSSEIEGWRTPDIGPAGVGLLAFDVGPGLSRFSLVVVDANNSVLSFREKVIAKFEQSSQNKVLELCTSDTHVTAAKTSDAKGYLALGDVVPPEKLADVLGELERRALAMMNAGSFQSSVAESKVKTIGSEVLNDFSLLLDATSKVAKRGARLIGIVGIAITIAVALI